MGYVYDSVVAILGGKPLVNPTKDGKLVSGWSPNMFRRVAILTDGVVVEYHGFDHRTRVVPFDMVKVSEDMAQGAKYKNPLRPLFEYKALSCLEEVFISEALVTDKMVNTYLATLVSTHRLRCISLVPSNLNISLLESLFKQSNDSTTWYMNLIGDSITGAKNKKIDVADFHKRHYLRPALYQLDSTEGNLSKYFAKIESLVSSRKAQEGVYDIGKSFLQEDNKKANFWLEVAKFLRENNKGSRYSGLVSSLKSACLAKGDSYVKGLKELHSSESSRSFALVGAKVYTLLGYLSVEGSGSPKQNQEGYLPRAESVGKLVKPEIARLISSGENESLSLIKIKKDANDADILYEVLKVLNSESTGNVNDGSKTEVRSSEDVSGDLEGKSKEDIDVLRNEILVTLPEEFMRNLRSVLRDTTGVINKLAKLYMENLNSGPKFSEKELERLSLPVHLDVFKELNYLGGSSDVRGIAGIDFSKGLDSLCKQVTRTPKELADASWLSLDVNGKCQYILERGSK